MLTLGLYQPRAPRAVAQPLLPELRGEALHELKIELKLVILAAKTAHFFPLRGASLIKML